MRTLLRYLLVSVAIVCLAWTAVAVDVDGRSAVGHLRNFGGEHFDGLVHKIRTEYDKRAGEFKDQLKTRTKQASGDPPPKSTIKRTIRAKKVSPVTPASSQDARVSALQRAAARAEPTRPRKIRAKKVAKTKTRVDERIPKAAEDALDALLTTRIRALD